MPEMIEAPELGNGGQAMVIDREARLREVLAEVNVLDLWDATKAIFTQWGCLAIFFIVAAIMGQIPAFLTGTSDGFGIPDWLIWLFVIWAFVGGYTADKSYHEHRFAWYFPKAGFLWSIPLACYFMVGIQIFRGIGPDADAWERTGRFVLAAAWWFPFFLAVSLLEIGHNRLMEKRAERQPISKT
jgi:hypothetical protein